MVEWQAGFGVSLAGLIGGILGLTAYMYFMAEVYSTMGLNTMEVAQISTTISWFIVVFVLLCYTWRKSG